MTQQSCCYNQNFILTRTLCRWGPPTKLTPKPLCRSGHLLMSQTLCRPGHLNPSAITWAQGTHPELPLPSREQPTGMAAAQPVPACSQVSLLFLIGPGTPLGGEVGMWLGDRGPWPPTPESGTLRAGAGPPVPGSQWNYCGVAVIQFVFLGWLLGKLPLCYRCQKSVHDCPYLLK